MGRKPDPDRRPEILRAVVDELARSGLGDMSLRPLAAALGVSTYTLTYHFGSKERLLAEALEFVEREQLELARSWVRDRPGRPGEPVERYWDWAARPENLARVRLIFEALTVPRLNALLEPGFRGRLMSAWAELMTGDLERAGVDRERAETEGTLAASALAGMVLDLLATGDAERLHRAARALARRLTELQEEARLEAGTRGRGGIG